METIAVELKNVAKTFYTNKRRGIFDILKDSTGKNQNIKITALDNLSFSINKGETIGLIGLNGSGKTTLLRIISGIYPPDSGNVVIKGKIAPLLQIGIGFNNELNAEENIIIYGMLLGLSKLEAKSKIDKIIEFAELEKFRNLKLQNYSTGMRARLGFGTALEVNPDILLVDEVLAVGDEVFRKKSFEAFLSFKKNHKTIIFATHALKMIEELSDRVILMDKGKIIKFGIPSEVIPVYREIIKKHGS